TAGHCRGPAGPRPRTAVRCCWACAPRTCPSSGAGTRRCRVSSTASNRSATGRWSTSGWGRRSSRSRHEPPSPVRRASGCTSRSTWTARTCSTRTPGSRCPGPGGDRAGRRRHGHPENITGGDAMSDPMNVLAPEHRRLRIGDAWRDAAGGATFAVEDPATGKTIAEVADAGVADGLAALGAAAEAMAEWAATPPRKRSELLTATYRALTERSEEVARLITLEMGKPLAEARGEVAYAAEFFRWF